MSSIPQSAANGGPAARAPAARARRKLYRYRPVPPVAFDEDGYPCEDGMGQDTDHIALFGYALALKRHLAGRAAVHSDLSTHYAYGDRGAVIVPDLFVAFGGEERSYRRSYKLWEDPAPAFVLEVLSKKTWRQDVGPKKDTYAFLGVRECWLYDPKAHWLATPLEGYRLRGKAYAPVPPSSPGRYESEALGLELRLRGRELRFFDPEGGGYLRTLDEEAEAAASAQAEAAAAREQATRALEQGARAREQAARARTETMQAVAAAERRAAEAERRAAEAERELAATRAKLEER